MQKHLLKFLIVTLVSCSVTAAAEIRILSDTTESSEDSLYLDNNSYKLHWNTTSLYAGWKSSEKAKVNSEVIYIDTLTKFTMPVPGKKTSEYSRLHTGWDLNLKEGEPVKSAFEGRVRFAGMNNGGYGNIVIVRHASGIETWYAHLSATSVVPGQRVKSGETIGLGGSTGRSTGPHLHWEMRYKDVPLDLAKIIDYGTKSIPKRKIKVKDLTGDGMLALTHHKISDGDTMESIAKKHNSTPERLTRLNGLAPNHVLIPGKYIRVR
jgi:murein DD-endopeptidase MepM/ murein hydrolase activator NlpD